MKAQMRQVMISQLRTALNELESPDEEEESDPELAGLIQWFVEQPKHVRRQINTTRVTPTIGRNDPCLCGSGKKFKKCCINT